MHAEDLLVNDGTDRKAIEAVSEGLPKLDVIAPLALVIEPINSVDRSALVVAAQQEEILWVLDLVRQEQADRFKRLLPAIHIVSQEEVVGIGREASVFEQPQKVVVLTMDIT